MFYVTVATARKNARKHPLTTCRRSSYLQACTVCGGCYATRWKPALNESVYPPSSEPDGGGMVQYLCFPSWQQPGVQWYAWRQQRNGLKRVYFRSIFCRELQDNRTARRSAVYVCASQNTFVCFCNSGS